MLERVLRYDYSSMWITYIVFTLFLVFQSNSFTAAMDAKALASAVAKFSAKFCNELDKSKSVVSSPLSAEILLALLTLGTTDPAHTELLTSLGISDDDSIRSGFSLVTEKLKSIKGVTLNVANKVYVMEGDYDLHPELKQDAIKVFDAGFEKVDFNASAAAASLINKWVEDKTNSRIKDLISQDSLDGFTRLVLVNAIYFKGTWSKQFDPESTMDQPFHVTASNTIQVPMMYKEDNFRYGESDALNAQFLEMNYVGGEASMLIVLPRDIEGLGEVLQKLANGFDLLAEVEQKMHSTKVQVTIPKFKIETEIDLNDLLPKLGIKSIFSQLPGGSGLTKVLNCDEPLYVSKAIQKAFIEVNEEGAEAAAATGVRVCVLRCARPPPPPAKKFRADRPFLYFLLTPPHTALFIGVTRGNQYCRTETHHHPSVVPVASIGSPESASAEFLPNKEEVKLGSVFFQWFHKTFNRKRAT